MTKRQREQQRRAREKRKRQEERKVRRAAMLAEAAILGERTSSYSYGFRPGKYQPPLHPKPRPVSTADLRARLRDVRR